MQVLINYIFSHNLLKSLIMCNGKRCSHAKNGCVSGCVNQKSLHFLPKSGSTQNALSDLENNIKSPRSLSKIEELEAPEQMVQQHSWNKYHELEHEEIYDDMIKRLTEMANKKENATIISVPSKNKLLRVAAKKTVAGSIHTDFPLARQCQLAYGYCITHI